MAMCMNWIGIVVVGALAGCGPETSTGDGDAGDDGSSGGESGTSSTSVTSTTTTTGADADSGPGDSTGEPQCDALVGQDGTEIALGVRNAGATPIFLDMNGCGPVISLFGPDGNVPTRWLFPDCDMPSCDSLVSGDCSVACGGGGACQLEIIRLEAGGVHTHDWSGSVFVEVTAPLECTAPDCAPGCFQRVPAIAGTYDMTANVYHECPLADPAGCECEPIDGQCTVVADNIVAMPTEVGASFEYPAQTAPEIAVQ